MNNFKQYGSHMIKLIFACIGATLLLLWGWNISIPDLFGLPAMKFKQATGLMILIGIISVFISGACQGRRKNTSPYHVDSVWKKES